MRVLILILFTALSSGLFGQNCDCGGSATLDAGAGFDTYLWSTNETTQSINVPMLCPSDDGTYSVTVTDDCGQDQDVQTFGVCTSGPISISDAFFNNNGLCIYFTQGANCCENPNYRWTDPCGAVVSTTAVLNGEFGGQITVCGIYTLELLDCNGCTECYQVATYNIQSSTGCCGGNCGCVGCAANINSSTVSITCNGTANYSANTCTGASYSWESTLNGNIVATGSGPNFSFIPNSNGTYVVTLTVLDDCGITSTDMVNTTVNDCQICEDCSNSVIFANNTPDCDQLTTFSINCPLGFNYNWSVTGGGGFQSGDQFFYTPTATGTYTVTVTFTDDCGNNLFETFTFSVTCVACEDCTGSSLIPDGTPQCEEASIILINCSSASNIEWRVNGVLQSETGQTLDFTPTANGTYNVTVQFDDECDNTINESYTFTITDCNNCNCVVSLTHDDIDCEMDYTVTGCTNWQLRRSGNANCTGVSTAASGSGDATGSYDICGGLGDGYYQIVALENGCPAEFSGCLEADCCCSGVFDHASIPEIADFSINTAIRMFPCVGAVSNSIWSGSGNFPFETYVVYNNSVCSSSDILSSISPPGLFEVNGSTMAANATIGLDKA